MLAPMSEELAGKSGIVTGAASGIGREIAAAFVAAGARVAVLDQDGAGARAAADELGPAALGLECDITDEGAVGAIFGEVAAAYDGLDFLVNNAGVRHVASIVEETLDAWRHTLEVNLTGTFICSRAAIAPMLSRGGGSIVNLASMAGELALTDRSAYTVSKAGIVALTKSLAVELGDQGIRANAIAPGVIETPLSAPYFEDEAMVATLRENSPLGRWGQVGEIAAPAVFLCSDAASFVHGATLFVDGGWTVGKGY
jgi:NAD(P)-dependent dehydrogenase (short-subunit alcohol dehydrogenase family)